MERKLEKEFKMLRIVTGAVFFVFGLGSYLLFESKRPQDYSVIIPILVGLTIWVVGAILIVVQIRNQRKENRTE